MHPAIPQRSKADTVLAVVAAASWPAVILFCFATSWSYWWLIFIPIFISSIASNLRKRRGGTDDRFTDCSLGDHRTGSHRVLGDQGLPIRRGCGGGGCRQPFHRASAGLRHAARPGTCVRVVSGDHGRRGRRCGLHRHATSAASRHRSRRHRGRQGRVGGEDLHRYRAPAPSR